MTKQKLTLSVDREIVEKAKNWGLNISEITEKILKDFIADVNDKFLKGHTLSGAIALVQEEEFLIGLYDAYKQLFASIVPVMRKFGVEEIVVAEGWTGVGEGEEYEEYDYKQVLCSDGSFFEGDPEGFFRDIRKINPQDLLPPKKILSNLVNALVTSRKKRKEKVKEILMAKKIVDAIAEAS